MTDQILHGFRGRDLVREPLTEADHFTSCPDCGQVIDLRVLAQVVHHEKLGHEAEVVIAADAKALESGLAA